MKEKRPKCNVQDFLPMGEEAKPLFRLYIIFLGVLFLLSLQFFYHFWHFQVEQAWILEQEGLLIQTEYFGQLLKHCFHGLHYFYIWCFGLGIHHYYSHTRGSKSIYLMKRLPNRWEFVVRIWTFPVVFALVTGILTFTLLFLYYHYYLHFSVPDTIPESQLEIFIDLWFQGGEKYAEIRKYQ